MFSSFLAVVVLVATAPGGSASENVVTVHGSGTSNPSKCYWLIMDQFMNRIKIPTRLTYRAVGSSTGAEEFSGVGNFTKPFNDFGSGDFPLTSVVFKNVTSAGIKILHLPIVASPISLFHSVPGVGAGSMSLTPCVLARILTRKIIYWDSPEITATNPSLKTPSASYPIIVGHRVLGSSSTYALTRYLRDSCPTEWPETSVGVAITWDASTKACEGSNGMAACIKNFPGTIGYIDSGHGYSQGLTEVILKNKDGHYLDAATAIANGGILSALGTLPTSADRDFSSVFLVNQAGLYTWPIVVLSYIYVRKDLSFMTDADSRGLLKAFLTALYDPSYINQCQSLYSQIPVPPNVVTMGLAGIAMLSVGTKWVFETSVAQPYVGQGNYVISVSRQTYAEVQRLDLAVQTSALSTSVAALTAASSTPSTTYIPMRVNAALGLAILSLLLWIITMTVVAVRFFCCKARYRSNDEGSMGIMMA